MPLELSFYINSILLGIGLTMDAFSVSLANGLENPNLKNTKTILIAGTFSLFQAIMPLTGYFFVHTFIKLFNSFEKLIPIISLLLLSFIGIKMIFEGIRPDCKKNTQKLSLKILVIQGIATSIDALSVGFTISEYNCVSAIICASLIASITFPICISGVIIGKKIGDKFSFKASIFGGCILIFIGIEIFITNII